MQPHKMFRLSIRCAFMRRWRRGGGGGADGAPAPGPDRSGVSPRSSDRISGPEATWRHTDHRLIVAQATNATMAPGT